MNERPGTHRGAARQLEDLANQKLGEDMYYCKTGVWLQGLLLTARTCLGMP